MDGKRGLLSNGSFFFGELPDEGVKSGEEIFDVNGNQFVSIAAYLLLQLNLIDMEFFEIGNDGVIGAGIMDLFQHTQVKPKSLAFLLRLRPPLQHQLQESPPEGLQPLLHHQGLVWEVDVEAVYRNDEVDEAVD